ncbi:MAG: chloride channel protein [Geobacteraceae bacterium]|nr:chloride channel protein [Geobacteraceae bacterium]
MTKRRVKLARRFNVSPHLWQRRFVFWGGAVTVGCVASLFSLGSEYANHYFHKILDVSPNLPLVITPIGLAAVVYMTRKFVPGAQGSGIPQCIAAISLDTQQERNKLLSVRIAIGKVFLTILSLLAGASVGREGPTVQVGASIMHSMSRFARFSRIELDKGLILAGGASGVAAAFNTPLAGIVFAIEEMSRSFEERTSGTMITAVVISGVVSLYFLGNYTYFGHTSVSIPLNASWLSVAVCGCIGGLLGGAFSRTLVYISTNGLPGVTGKLMRTRPVLFAGLCGLLLACIGLASGNLTYGTGYQEARGIIENSGEASQGYGILKFMATVVSYLSGIPGGIFAPSLAIGAGFGHNLAGLVPYATPGCVVMLTMVAYFSGVVQAPITAFVIVMEMTDSHTMILPLMAASFIASAVSRKICPKPLYKTMAEGFLGKPKESD